MTIKVVPLVLVVRIHDACSKPSKKVATCKDRSKHAGVLSVKERANATETHSFAAAATSCVLQQVGVSHFL